MPKGRNKGFSYYMCKKFFHPSNPQNLERVYIAQQKLEQKEKLEKDKQKEYEREQERWDNRNMVSSSDSKDKLALSFMYEPPVGLQKKEQGGEVCEASTSKSSAGKDKDAKDCFKFDWQRKAPRESYAKDDPNITDHPFGIQVNFTKCMKCQIWGHSHTDKSCPKYGKARDEDAAEIGHLDEKKLINDMKKTQGLQFTSYGAWDNGKKGGKQYDLLFSSDDEDNKDLMLKMLDNIRKKKMLQRRKKAKKKVKNRRKRNRKEAESEDSSSENASRSRSRPRSRSRSRSRSQPRSRSQSRKKAKSRSRRKSESRSSRSGRNSDKNDKLKIMDEVDKILASSLESDDKAVKKEVILERIDDILFGNSAKRENDKRKKMLLEVDQILNGDVDESEEDGDTEESEEEECDTENSGDENELTESEMRLLNLISINKIDVKMNFPEKYKDSHCHFCRQEENTVHLSVCPVYDTVMRGSEFSDIKKDNVSVVKKALRNILAALQQRSSALSVTSLGEVSRENMKLLNVEEGEKDGQTNKDMMEILNQL